MITIADLESRLRIVEDRLAIYELIASYGPAVDSGDSRGASELWSKGGSYDVGGMGVTTGREAIEALFEGATHQTLIANGAGHMLSSPMIAIDGDQATAINYSCMFTKTDAGFLAARVAANHWRLERADGRWRVTKRINRLLDGSQEARDLLADRVSR